MDPPPSAPAEASEGKLAILGAVLETNVAFDPRLQAFVDAKEAERLNSKSKGAREGFCVECEDQAATVACNQCNDNFCFLCYQSQHRKGACIYNFHWKPDLILELRSMRRAPINDFFQNRFLWRSWSVVRNACCEYANRAVTSHLERAKFIPIRLLYEERKHLRLLEAALRVSEYTDKIDILSYGNKAKRIHAQIREICAVMSGLVVASDYSIGQQLVKDHDFKHNSKFFQAMFEIGRRHKIMNPEKMRAEYGKLLYILQDSNQPHVQELLEFSMVAPIKTVYSVLEEAEALDALRDPLIEAATREIVTPPGAPRYEVQRDIKQKERAIDFISSKYQNSKINTEGIKLCLYSIGDNNNYLACNRDPVDKMIGWLMSGWNEEDPSDEYDLSISFGQGGARLSHSHATQYHYVLQSLSLWRNILHDFFRLWYLAEQDLLDEENPYHLRDTGQGLNRQQGAPRVYRVMHTLLHQTQHRIGHWVGSSVIHLGDHNVPNAFMFLDKYSQVPRILNPIVRTIDEFTFLYGNNEGVRRYIDQSFGGPEKLRKDILVDFFRHAFDGSGADNFFDAGSCIDGRLTSAWNWCSKIDKKPYYPIFKLTGFIGFDGDFQA